MTIRADYNGIWAYECNQDYRCGVGYQYYSYSNFVSRYPYVAHYVSHEYPANPVKFSADYHQYACQNAGCVGYYLEEHCAYVTGAKATCAYCGYVGPIYKPCPVQGRSSEDN